MSRYYIMIKLYLKNKGWAKKLNSKKTSLFLAIVFSFLFLPLPAQYLDTIYRRGNDAYTSFSLLNSGEILTAGSQNRNHHILEITKLNANGQILDTLNIHYNPNDFFIANCTRGLLVQNDRVYHAYTNFYSRDSIHVTLAKLRLDSLDTIATKYYYINRASSMGTHAWSMLFDSDSTFLLSGCVARWVQEPDSVLKYDLFLSRFDTSLNLIWETTVSPTIYGRNYGPIGCDILVDSSGKILVTGNTFFYPILEIGFAARFDNMGNNLWYREYSGNIGMSGMYCVDNGNGTYQYVQNWWTTASGGQNDIIVGQMDSLGNILSLKRFGKIRRTQFAQDLIRTKDGNYYVSGIGYFGNFHSYGFKFSAQGDSLWYRTYHHDDSLDLAYVETFEEDPSGNLVHFGYHANNVNPNPGNGLFSWLYRTDENGCIFKDCDLRQDEIESLPKLSLYPNPSKGSFFLDITSKEKSLYVLEIYNTAGALLESHLINDLNKERISIKSTLTRGEFFVVLRDKQGTKLGVSKILITP